MIERQKTVYAASSGTPAQTTAYVTLTGQLKSQTDPDGVITRYAHNAKGELFETAIDCQRAVKTGQGWANENQPL